MQRDMPRSSSPGTAGVLASGGLDSCILLGYLLDQGWRVQPFYIESGLVWQRSERKALQRFLAALARPALKPLVALELPLDDVYQEHWSITGAGAPGADSPDEAVYLPGRNALLIIKAALWCQLNGIGELALAPLGSNPFADATEEFFSGFESVLNLGTAANLRISRPFGKFSKREVMKIGRKYPLELTFSCISPQGGLHCGECNKCEERREAFRLVGRIDRTVYAAGAESLAARRHGIR